MFLDGEKNSVPVAVCGSSVPLVLVLPVVDVVVATDPELACVDELLVVEADGVELLEQAASPSASRTLKAAADAPRTAPRRRIACSGSEVGVGIAPSRS